MAKYDEKSISGFTRDIEKIQAKPNLFIGPTDAHGLFTILREPCDNGVDEARAGRNSLVSIVIDDKGAYWVQDAGVGIPVKPHPKMKISTLTHVLTNLQSSGKMSGDAYKSSIGTHGVGIKATNALSSLMEVWTFRKDSGGWWYTRFEHGVEKVKPKKSTAPKIPGQPTPKLGTVVKFVPDTKFFGKSKLDIKSVAHWCEMTSYMNSGLTVKLSAASKSKTWMVKDGIRAYLTKRVTALGATPMNKQPMVVNSERIELAIAFADVEGSAMEFFTNTVRNVEAGVHADDMYRALFDSLKPHRGTLKFTATDIQDGLVGLLNYKIDAPRFDSQTKEKLVDERVSGACYKECLDEFTRYFNANKKLAKDLCKRAASLRERYAAFLKDKKLIKGVKKAQGGLSAKLADVSGSKVPRDKCELFLVEGDSAGGTAKLARDRTFQAVFSMKGKPLNVMGATKAELFKNTELMSLLAGIGFDGNAKDPYKKLRFGRIIQLVDPDVDGRHINTLLFALFWRYLPNLFKEGRVFTVATPEYVAKHKGQTLFGLTKDEIYKQAGTKKLDIRHVKGLGEMSEDSLQEVAFNVKTRRLHRVTSPASRGDATKFTALMGPDPSYRKMLLGVAAK